MTPLTVRKTIPTVVSHSQKISEPLKVPNLLAIQTDSFDRLVGNERWAKRLENAQAAGDTSVPEKSGLAEIFEEISPDS